jgi:hypothetical protein
VIRRFAFFFSLVLGLSSLVFFSGCDVFGGSDSGGSGDDGGVTHREKDVSGKLSVALGGSGPGLDEIVLDGTFATVSFENNDPDLFDLEVSGHTARVVPLGSGIGYVTPVVNGHATDPVEVTIPPQRLIQILLGEARGQLDREATTEEGDGGEQVTPGSVSVTGDAVVAVIRNRIDLINDEGAPSLFLADAGDYGSDPPLSYYDAVIEASSGSVYQFSPVKPGDPSHAVYLAAEAREDMDSGLRIAYDQAALTAASLFSGDTEDPTGGAFAFYSPTEDQNGLIQDALREGASSLPAGCGTSDANFPAFAPVQILVLKDVAPSIGGVPSFVFVRSRSNFEPAVTDERLQ